MTYDVVVIGAGLAGSATAWRAAARGLDVLVLEQFGPGHTQGSSHGSARIVRRAYADPLYVTLSGQAFELWREAELASDAALLARLGAVDFGAERRLDVIVANLAAAGVEHEVLDATEASARWPGMVFDSGVVHHSQGGTIDADLAVHTFLSLATGLGATVRHDSAVAALEVLDADRAGLTLASGERLQTTTVVLAAGAWLPDLASDPALGLALPPLAVVQQQAFHFPRRDFDEPPWPSVIHADHGYEVYHLSGGRDGGAGLDRKIGEHHFGKVTTAIGRDGQVDPRARERVIGYVERWLPGLEPVPSSQVTCLYTRTPSEHFIIDARGPLVVCSPCSGHGAKFAPAVGQWVTDLLTGDAELPGEFTLASHAADHPPSWSL